VYKYAENFDALAHSVLVIHRERTLLIKSIKEIGSAQLHHLGFCKIAAKSFFSKPSIKFDENKLF